MTERSSEEAESVDAVTNKGTRARQRDEILKKDKPKKPRLSAWHNRRKLEEKAHLNDEGDTSDGA